MTIRNVERRDSARWAFVSMELDGAESFEECRAGAVFVAGLPSVVPLEPVSFYETLVTCPTSRVAMGLSLASLRPTLRQFDAQGNLVYDAMFARGVTPLERSFWVVNGARVFQTPGEGLVRVLIR